MGGGSCLQYGSAAAAAVRERNRSLVSATVTGGVTLAHIKLPGVDPEGVVALRIAVEISTVRLDPPHLTHTLPSPTSAVMMDPCGDPTATIFTFHLVLIGSAGLSGPALLFSALITFLPS